MTTYTLVGCLIGTPREYYRLRITRANGEIECHTGKLAYVNSRVPAGAVQTF